MTTQPIDTSDLASIIEMPQLVGRTIVKAGHWLDGSSLSIKLDNGVILQVHATFDNQEDEQAILHIELEEAC